jgi:hypothetical protein
MEQNTVDSSKYKISLTSLDSRFADFKGGNNGSEWRMIPPQPLKNIMRIRMASAEIPLVEQTFTREKGNLSFYMKVGTSPNFTRIEALVPGNYSASALVSAIQKALQIQYSTNYTCTVESVTGMVTFTSPVAFKIDFLSEIAEIADQPTNWGLGYYLGFRKPMQEAQFDRVIDAWFIRGTSVINVQPNPYYLLSLKCPDDIQNVTHRLAVGNYLNAFAKVVLKDNYYSIQFDDNSNLMRKEYTFLAPVTIPFFHFSLLDPYGRPVNMFDTDWSVTIEVTEVVNSKTYGTISQTYQRY